MTDDGRPAPFPTRRRSTVRTLAALALIGMLAAPGAAAAASSAKTVEIDTASGPHVFDVEVMRSDEERSRGLMGRKSMPKSHGMLFDFQTEQPGITFWMKDTYIPLDMIFVSGDGHVVGIKHDAKPMDETLIPAGAPTLGVIELNAGMANAIDLAIGDRVKNPIFQPAE